ncbi:divalent-cation tolerance protein CutA [uncultured Maricaulis sp.]|uniref:divalent-cation tolerance protein CutA n=1 Tax=uncultured Maricaulis sp. TaxID=174710 RepID=UPI0030D83A62
MSKYRWIYTTWPEAALAKQVAQTLVGEGLCACANILPGMTSVYRWQGTIETASEVVMILKVSEQASNRLRARVLALHPATTPCYLALDINTDESSDDFLVWISNQSAEAP